jgi:hypothetical protein
VVATGDCHVLAMLAAPQVAGLHEVLYVGQCKPGGSTGRTVFDRLDSHQTLQKIYSEHQGSSSDIAIALIDISETYLSNTAANGWGDPDADPPAWLDWAAGADETAKSQATVNLVEGTLIRFFNPPYNRALTSSFPRQEQAPVRQMRELGIGHLFVALDCGPYGFCSPIRESGSYFLAYAALSDRRGVVDGFAEWPMERAEREQNLFVYVHHLEARGRRGAPLSWCDLHVSGADIRVRRTPGGHPPPEAAPR